MLYRFSISDALVLKVTGPDAQRYLQARLTNNIELLTDTESFFAAMLTAQGRAQGLFHVIYEDDNQYYLIAETKAVKACVEAFLQFKVADQVEVEQCTNVALLHIAGSGVHSFLENDLKVKFPSLDLNLTRDVHNNIIVRRFRGFEEGCDLLCALEQLPRIQELLKANEVVDVDRQEQELRRFISGIVSYDEELADSFFPEAGLSHAISLNKGCYVGQESLEMVFARGKLPARLMFFEVKADQPLADDTTMEFPESSKLSSKLISTYFDEDNSRLLGVVRVRNYSEDFSGLVTLAGQPVRLYSA